MRGRPRPDARQPAARLLARLSQRHASLIFDAGPALGVAVLVVSLSFHSGGYFPGAPAAGAVILALLLIARVALVARPFTGLSAAYVLGTSALGLLALWTLISGAWSGAPGRAILEYDRVLLYMLAFVVFGSMGRSRDRLRWMIRGLAAAAFVVCLCALITRLFPDVWPVSQAIVPGRLSYPLGYWNALGLLAAIGLVLSFALTSDEREPRIGRVLAAGALPVFAATQILTFSRGSLLAGVLGLLVLIMVGRPRMLAGAALATGPAVLLASFTAYRADLIASDTPATAAAAAEGHGVALVLGVCVVIAVAARCVAFTDRRWQGWRAPPVLRDRMTIAAGLGAVVLVALALGAAGKIESQVDGFVNGDAVNSAQLSSRLSQSGDNGRLAQWRVAIGEFEASPLLGQGAGTHGLAWARNATSNDLQVQDAHSLYIEVLGELGVIGFVLAVGAVLIVLGGFLARARGSDRMTGAALLGAGIAWALSAGVDWAWEVPAITCWFFAVGGLAVSRRHRAPNEASWEEPLGVPMALRVGVGVMCVVLVVVPVRVYLSEGPLRAAVQALARGDCQRASTQAADSIDALDVRPEPFVLAGYCDIQAGRGDLAVRALSGALRRDPNNWEMHYGLAVARASAGLDPRPEGRIAKRLRPRDPRPVELLRRFDTDDPALWRTRAREVRPPA